MSGAHTPAPWADAGGIGFGRLLVGPNGENIAVAYGPSTNPNSVRDFALMKSAPALHDALLLALRWMEQAGAHAPDTMAKMRAALASAEVTP